MERGAFRDRLDQLVRWGLKINWTLLRAGYCGKGFIPPQFTQEDIVAYALEKLKTVEENLVAVLAGAENDRYEFESTLNALAKNEGPARKYRHANCGRFSCSGVWKPRRMIAWKG